MKNYNLRIYRQHYKEVSQITDDPFSIEYYYRGVVDIANGLGTDEQSSGILNKNDIIQECHIALIEAWANVDWDAIRDADEPQARLWSFLKKSVKLKGRERIHNVMDAVRIPHGKRWELIETKNVDNFLAQLFPPEWFAENDKKLNLYDSNGYIERYDIEQLGLAFQDVFLKYLTRKEIQIIEWFYGLDYHKLSTKQIAQRLKITGSNVSKTKHVALQKLNNEEVKEYLQSFYDFR